MKLHTETHRMEHSSSDDNLEISSKNVVRRGKLHDV